MSVIYRRKSQKPFYARFLRSPQVFFSALFALLNQFRLPLLVFLLVTVGGGYAYGELHRFSGREAIAFIDLPYTMLQLMLLETPLAYDAAPEEWYLIAFWYILPPIFLFIIGNGVADFVRLFFGDTWQKVRMSNRENHVIVLGAGHVGLRVVRWLRQWHEHVVVIDNAPNDDKVATLKALGVELIVGDAQSGQLLKDANIDDAASFIACTGDDVVNLYAIMRARFLNPDIHIVVRVWDDSFNEQIEQFILQSQKELPSDVEGGFTSILSSSDLSAPIFAGLALGIELTQSLSINNEAYGMVRLEVQANSPFANKNIGQIQAENVADVVLYQSGMGHFQVRPSRDRQVKAGDSLVLFAKRDDCINFAKANKSLKDFQGHIVILGAGHVGLRVVCWLVHWGMRVVVVDFEIEADVHEALEELGDMVEIIEADGREKETLERAGIDNALAFVAATGDDAINLYAIMRARAMNPYMQIVVRVWDDSFNEQIERFIVQAQGNGNGSITSVRSSADLAAPIFAGLSLGIDLTQTLIVSDRENKRQTKYAAVRLVVEVGSAFENQSIAQIQERSYLKQRADVVAYCDRQQVSLAPDSKRNVRAGDILVVFSELNACIEIAKMNRA